MPAGSSGTGSVNPRVASHRPAGQLLVSRTQQYLTFAAAILVTGVLSGIAGGFTTVVVKAIEHVAYGFT